MRRARILQPFMNLLAEFGNSEVVQTVFKGVEDPMRSRLVAAKVAQFGKMRCQLFLPPVERHRAPKYSRGMRNAFAGRVSRWGVNVPEAES